jgi:phosphatidylglycerophosphate synthase
VRAAHAGPAIGLIAQVLLLAALAETVGLGGAGWVVGITCGVIANTALALGISSYGSDRLSPADWVTLARATLAVGVAALVADSFDQPAPLAMLVTLTVVALMLDTVDGRVARRSRTASALGARFDGEVDAFLILALSVYVARSAGAWVLAIGAARYVFLAAGWVLPWLREPLPPRYWRKVAAATQGIVLAIAGRRRSAEGPDPSCARRRACPAGRVVRPRRLVAVEPPAHDAPSSHGRPACASTRHCGAHDPRPFCSRGSPSSLPTSRVVSRPARSCESRSRASSFVALALALPCHRLDASWRGPSDRYSVS